MGDDLKERLLSHERAFDGLLSLIPAKIYYGEDVSDQWQRKKQTPEKKRAAKMAKLDPDNWKSAKDVMDERAAEALKRKRDQADSASVNLDTESELPISEQQADSRQAKKRKTGGDNKKTGKSTTQPDAGQSTETDEQRRQRKIEQKAAKRERKRMQKAKVKEKQERQKERKRLQKQDVVGAGPKIVDSNQNAAKKSSKKEKVESGSDEEEPSVVAAMDVDMDIVLPADERGDTASSVSEDQVPIFSPQNDSAGSSTSSIQTGTSEPAVPSKESLPAQPSTTKPTLPAPNTQSNSQDPSQTPKDRLQAVISQFRTERKADGTELRPAKNRQELLEQRRKKEAERKAAKKEQKRREREEKTRQEDEEIARRFSPGGSGSLLASPRSPLVDGDSNHTSVLNNTNFTYGRIAFSDGTQLHQNSGSSSNPSDPNMTVSSSHKSKSTSTNDTLSHLKHAETKKTKFSNLSDSARTTLEQKDMWLNAKKRAHGERVRDDSSLLKKTLKRQQSAKKKSEREWSERKQGVEKAQASKQKKRTENLAKRRDEKNSGKTGGGKPKGKKITKRPGFEGSFRARTSSAGKGKK